MKTHALPDSGPTSGVNKLQDSVADGVGGQFAQGGLLSGVGETTSKEGVDRVERGEPQQHAQQSKSWTQSLTGGYLGNDNDADKK